MFAMEPIGTCLHLPRLPPSNPERPVYPSERWGKWPQIEYEGDYTDLRKHNLTVVSSFPVDSIPIPRECTSLGSWLCGVHSQSIILQYQISVPNPTSAAGSSPKWSSKRLRSSMSDDRLSLANHTSDVVYGPMRHLGCAHPGCQSLVFHRALCGLLLTKSVAFNAWSLLLLCQARILVFG